MNFANLFGPAALTMNASAILLWEREENRRQLVLQEPSLRCLVKHRVDVVGMFVHLRRELQLLGLNRSKIQIEYRKYIIIIVLIKNTNFSSSRRSDHVSIIIVGIARVKIFVKDANFLQSIPTSRTGKKRQ